MKILSLWKSENTKHFNDQTHITMLDVTPEKKELNDDTQLINCPFSGVVKYTFMYVKCTVAHIEVDFIDSELIL